MKRRFIGNATITPRKLAMMFQINIWYQIISVLVTNI